MESLQKGSEVYKYVVQNLTWSVAYLRINLSNTFLQKVLTLVQLTATGPEVFVATTTTFLSDFYDDLEETLTHTKIIKIKSYPGENIAYFCAVILVDDDQIESIRAFKPEHIGYITHIFEDNYDFIFHRREIKKYKEVTDFIKKLCVCDMYVISPDDIITYEYLVQ